MRFALALSIVVLAACGGNGPTGPTKPPPPIPTTPGQTVPPPPTTPVALAISPSSVTMGVGQEVVFTVSGGDGGVYSYNPVQPGYAFETDQVSANRFRVKMFGWSDVSRTVFTVDTMVNGQMRGISASITVK